MIITPVIEIAHRPPEARLQGRSDKDRVITTADVVFIWREMARGELEIEVI